MYCKRQVPHRNLEITRFKCLFAIQDVPLGLEPWGIIARHEKGYGGEQQE
jgi:hypothetical protein